MTYDEWLDDYGEAIGNWYDANKLAMVAMCPTDMAEDDFALFVVNLFNGLPADVQDKIKMVGANGPTISEIFGSGSSAKTTAT